MRGPDSRCGIRYGGLFGVVPVVPAAVAGLLLPATTSHVRAVSPDFDREIKPLLREHCGDCHVDNKRKGGFSMNTRADLLAGSESGEVVEPGSADRSLLIELVSADEADDRMPPKGEPLDAAEIALLRAWIDEGLPWPDGFAFGDESKPAIAYREVEPPGIDEVDLPDEWRRHPIDRLMAAHWEKHGIQPGAPADDRTFIRRASLDIIGILPDPKDADAFASDASPDKRARLVRRLLADRIAYADHWMTFWNDLLRNAYYGTGFIDGGRTQITGWLYQSLVDNVPYDRFAKDLVSGAPGAEGYIKGIVWRGVVNASQQPAMQAAQNVSQVFLGTNLKCASCHDSFVDGWKLADAYAFAGVFSAEGPLDVVRCDKPTGEMSGMALPFPELGAVDPQAGLADRLIATSEAIASPENGLFARTMVNRVWKEFFGYGLVEPMDSMARPSWHPDLLDWLACEFRDGGFDLKRLIELICTSRSYALPAAPSPSPKDRQASDFTYAFEGPWVRRLTAEQLLDVVAGITDSWPDPAKTDIEGDQGRGQGGQFLAMKRAQEAAIKDVAEFDAAHAGGLPIDSAMRAAAVPSTAFLRVMGRPSRDQVVVERESIASTLQALELTNGATFDAILADGARYWLERHPDADGAALATEIHRAALVRDPTPAELTVARDLLGTDPSESTVADYLWAVIMLPELQLIH